MNYAQLQSFRPVALAVIAFWSLVLSAAAFAQPFVVADVVAGVSQCGVYLNAAPKVTVPASSLLCKYDISGVSVGSHTIRMTAISVADPIWGTQESVQSAALNFTRPAVPVTPSTPRLSAQ